MSPPVARTEIVRDSHFGTVVDDPYRWMEAESGEFDSWLTGQGRCARESLDALEHRRALLARIRDLRDTAPQRSDFAFAGGRVFWRRQDPTLAVPVLVVQAETDRVLFDPNIAIGTAHHHLDWYVPSPDGRHVVCATSVAGGETCTLRIVDVASGALLDEAIGNVRFPFLSWLHDGRRFVYHRYLIECICSDTAVHRARIEGRVRGIPGWQEVGWDHVQRMRAEVPPR
jgi:prolyl oligopeptidase